MVMLSSHQNERFVVCINFGPQFSILSLHHIQQITALPATNMAIIYQTSAIAAFVAAVTMTPASVMAQTPQTYNGYVTQEDTSDIVSFDERTATNVKLTSFLPHNHCLIRFIAASTGQPGLGPKDA